MTSSKTSQNQYSWGNNCQGWHLLQSKNLHIIEELMPPKTEEQYHFHEKAEQFFYILAGVATFIIDEKEITVFSNEGVHIPPKTNHKIINNTERDLRFLLVSQPTTKGDRTNLE